MGIGPSSGYGGQDWIPGLGLRYMSGSRGQGLWGQGSGVESLGLRVWVWGSGLWLRLSSVSEVGGLGPLQGSGLMVSSGVQGSCKGLGVPLGLGQVSGLD